VMLDEVIEEHQELLSSLVFKEVTGVKVW
jgi:hypothetical protein